jgi:hypothetical protein
MPVTTVNAAASTVQVKLGGGVLRGIQGVSTGTAYTFQCVDGPNSAGTNRTLIGAAAIPVVAGQQWVTAAEGIPFTNGLAFIVAGTPGEFFVQWD